MAALRRRRRLFQVDWSRSKKREAQRKIDAARYDMDMDEFEAARAELDLLRGGLPQLVKIGLGDSSPVTGEKRKLEHALDTPRNPCAAFASNCCEPTGFPTPASSLVYNSCKLTGFQPLQAHWFYNSCKLSGPQ